MSSFTCPFCGQLMSLHYETFTAHRLNFRSSSTTNVYNHPHLQIRIYKCPNETCGKESIFAEGINGYIDNSLVAIYPSFSCVHFPDYVPLAIREDYEEACSILSRSPKAAATLARRCLQGMIHDFWDIHGKNLNAEITQLKSLIPAGQWKAIDVVRSIGNIGAHMEHDVSKIIDVDVSEADKLIALIEHLIRKWYIDRHDEEELYNDLVSIDQAKQEIRGLR